MRQAGLFGLSDHLKRLSVCGDPLEELGHIIDFEVFRPVLVAALAYGDGAKGGRPPYDPVAMLKVLILAAQNNVSDARMEYLIRDRLSWLRFLGFAVHELAHAITPRATLISRLRLDASLFALPARRTSRTMGRPAQKGPALPKLKTMLANSATRWTSILVSAWYGHVNGKTLEITSDIALWYRPGTPVLPVRWVLVRDPDGKRDPQAFFSTDITLEPADIIALYVRRWQIEVTFAETRAHLGVETQRQWTDNAIARTTPALLGLYSLISLWACDLLTASSTPYSAAWYRKTSLTFSDAIGAVRLQLWVGDINQHFPPHREPHYIPTTRLVRMAQALCFAT